MKLARYGSVLPIILCVLTIVAAADSKQKGEIKLSSHVMVSGTQLEPGNYDIRWSVNGSDVQVTFLHEGEEVARSNGRVIQQKNPQESVTMATQENGSRVLTEIDLPNATLILTPAEVSTSGL